MKEKKQSGCLKVLFVAFILGVIIWNIIPSGDIETPVARIKIETEDGFIRFTNIDTVDYQKTKIEINDKYSAKLVRLDRNTPVVLQLTEFSDKDGNRFSPIMKINTLFIYAQTDHGATSVFYEY